MIVKLLIVGPLMRGLQGAIGGGLSIPGFNPIAGVTGHADGTNYAPGGWSLVGENGPELMNVPSGAQVLPNGKYPSGGGGTPNLGSNGDVTVTLNKAVDTAVGNSMSSGQGMRVLGNQYGVKQFMGQ
jgi:hypothetical protein